MWETVKKNLIQPMSTRVGTLVAGMLAPFGVHAETSQMITIGIIGVGCLAVDLIAARFARKRIADEASK